MIDGMTELAKMFKNRENGKEYAPTFGIITKLPNLEIKVSDLINLTQQRIKSCIDLAKTDSDGKYIYLGKTVVLLPYNNYQNYIVIGVVV